MLRRHFPPQAIAPGTSSQSGQPERAYDQACMSERNCGRWETRYIETIPVTAANCDFPYAAQLKAQIPSRTLSPSLWNNHSYLKISPSK